MSLTSKQILFCQEYIVDLNATKAAIRAGYSEDTAYSIGSENLKKPEIAEKVQEYMDLRSKRTEITADRVLAELAKLGFSDIRKIMSSSNGLKNIADLDDDIASAISAVEVVVRNGSEHDEDGNPIPEYVHKIRLADKKGALELMGKHLKLYTDVHEVGMRPVVKRIDLTGSDGK